MVDSRFWDRTVLQACHTVPAVRHAVLALASWHQLSNSPLDIQHRNYADKQYQLALLEAGQLIQSSKTDDIDKILIACIVFICFEGVRGEYRAAQLHMDNGRNIAKQHAERFRQNARRNDLSEIQHAMARLDLPAVTFSDSSSPYHYTLEDFRETEPCLMPWSFANLGEARTCLVDLCRWTLIINSYLDRAVYSGDVERAAVLQADKEMCGTRITSWKTCFDRVVEDEVERNENDSSSPHSTSLLVLMLRLWYHAVKAMNQDACYGPETRYDAVEEHFGAIVEIGEAIVQQLTPPSPSPSSSSSSEISFSYDIGYTIILFFAATRCRHPLIRRRAIAVLRAVNRQEGTWASFPAAAISQRWMEIEEEGLGEILCAKDVTEERRVVLIRTKVLAKEERAVVGFGVVTMRGEAVFRQEEIVSWGREAG